MSVSYYNYADFSPVRTDDDFTPCKLRRDVNLSSICQTDGIASFAVKIDGDKIELGFTAVLSADQKLVLDGLVNDHVPELDLDVSFDDPLFSLI